MRTTLQILFLKNVEKCRSKTNSFKRNIFLRNSSHNVIWNINLHSFCRIVIREYFKHFSFSFCCLVVNKPLKNILAVLYFLKFYTMNQLLIKTVKILTNLCSIHINLLIWKWLWYSKSNLNIYYLDKYFTQVLKSSFNIVKT